MGICFRYWGMSDFYQGTVRRGRQYSLCSMREIQNSNIKSHYTDMYNYAGLIFRRGIPFTIEIDTVTYRNFDYKNTSIHLVVLGCGEKKIILDKNFPNFESCGWKFDIEKTGQSEPKVKLNISSPSDAIVGEYKLYLNYNGKLIGTQRFVLFFNPFCSSDDVYMPDDEDIQEYIFNDSTKIYMGTEDYIVAKDWDLGQFETGSVEGAIMLLKMMPSSSRTRASEVSRQLSALINANDDNGVLVGNWSGKYQDGTCPMAWEGSAPILTKYARTRRPVRYGQCWVFSGILCTVLKTIGIPARCVTNYSSLHDTDGSLKWEIYLDAEFNPITTGGDSCWNFHCWNEAWIKRLDLSSDHDGWQVLDATPQERSGGLFRLGPASRMAVKKGLIELPYDVGFVYAEVNADKVFYLQQADGSFKQYMVKKNELGRMILTKRRLSEKYEDLTRDYKLDENSTMDSLIDVEHSRMRSTENSITRKIKIEIITPSSVSLTEDLSGVIIVRGLSDKMESILKAEALLMSYTGKNICKLYNSTEKISITERKIEFKISKETLTGSVTEEFPFIKVRVYCFDSNQDELGFSEKVISVKTPDLEIQGIPKECKTGSKIECTVTIANTLNVPLTNTRLRVKFTDDKERIIKLKNIFPAKRLAQDFTIVPKCIGRKKLYVTFESDECCGFSNVAKFKAIN